ncbi:MAG: hypothetical protein D6760_11530 [Deltaproteobacteria bacterium]|nr:MAG: hypothetical protein D6760_11530 [Deltaproteobacteria bacterium]
MPRFPSRTTAAVLIAGSIALCAAALGCSARAPANIDDACSIFGERHGWFDDARRAEKRWGVPIEVQLAIIHQESRFRARAQQPRRRLLGLIPWRRRSSAYGYTQAVETTWDEYRRATGHRGADRDDFGDACDFIGWYAARSSRRLGIAKNDAYRLYLAYHEGDGGYRRGTYRSKPWLLRVASKVERRAARYRRQLAGCRGRLEHRWRLWW